jgi:hypothetical protein
MALQQIHQARVVRSGGGVDWGAWRGCHSGAASDGEKQTSEYALHAADYSSRLANDDLLR